MNNATFHDPMIANRPLGDAGNEFAYRSVSRSAVACIVFSILGALTSWLAPVFVLLPVLGVVFGIVALVNFKKYPGELIGKSGAKIGLGVSLVFLVVTSSTHFYIYSTEVPEGYVRMAYSDLRPNLKTALPFSEKAIDLDGEKVFLKGYVRPSTKTRGLKEFILVGDFGDCCFGGNPKITDIVAITIVGDETVDYSYALRRIGGTFKLNKDARNVKDKDIPGVFYEIIADHVR